jgi:hypothetical protein
MEYNQIKEKLTYSAGEGELTSLYVSSGKAMIASESLVRCGFAIESIASYW